MPYLPAPGGSFGLIVDLRNQAGVDGISVTVNSGSTLNDGNGGTYIWDATSTTTDDGLKVIKVTNLTAGRWIRSQNANYATGRNTFSGITLQTAYVITHGLGYVPSSIQTEAETAGAGVARWVSNRTSTTFTINFSTVPLLGTNNLTISWVAYK